MKREEGYYWIKFEGKWVVALWDKAFNGADYGEWFLPREPFIHPNTDADFEEIDPKQITRNP